MRLGTVVGQVVSTAKDASLSGFTLLIVAPFPREAADGTASADDASFVAVDLIGAGPGEVVLCTHGSGARVAAAASGTATDCAVVAIADTVVLDNQIVYSK